MPSRNSLKVYVEDGYYHIYNRGINKSEIFIDSQDYFVFLNYLKEHLAPKDEKSLWKALNDPSLSSKEKQRLSNTLTLKNYNSELVLMAYCLMPNHFHFFIKQKTANAMNQFMSSISIRYAMYFNRKYKRIGPVFQDAYKAILITNEAHYLHLSRYIHKQALTHDSPAAPEYPSSYPEYLGMRKTAWVHPDEILSFFAGANPNLSYSSFVTEYNPLFDYPDHETEI